MSILIGLRLKGQKCWAIGLDVDVAGVWIISVDAAL